MQLESVSGSTVHVQEWFFAEGRSGVFEDNLHALAIIGTQHTDRIL